MNPILLIVILSCLQIILCGICWDFGYRRGIKGKDAEWNSGFICGAKEVGLTRDNSGRFRSLNGIGKRTPANRQGNLKLV